MLFRFVPYVGVPIAFLFPATLALAVDPGWSMLFSVMTLFGGVEAVIGQVVEPFVYGRSMGLSAVAVVVAAVFWTWLDRSSEGEAGTTVVLKMSTEAGGQKFDATMTNKLASWHNVPNAPAIAQPMAVTNTLKLSVPEQVGIAYSLFRAPAVTSTNWTEVTNYVRQIETNAAVVSLSDPAPAPPARAFYRVNAAGR